MVCYRLADIRPMFVAIKDGNIEGVKQAIAEGADMNVQTIGGWTPLHIAVFKGHKEIAELLIDKDADVNAKNWEGGTPLHYAALTGRKEIAELLIDNGADVNEKTDDGRTPLDFTKQTKQKATADLLRKHGGKTGVEVSIHWAARGGDIEAVKQYLVAGVDIELKCTRCGGTALVHAAQYGHKEIADLLIANGANVNAKNESSFTPLHGAAMLGYMEITELLITNGADVNAKLESGEGKGDTPLDMATISDNPNDTGETADLLRKHGGKTGVELKAEGK